MSRSTAIPVGVTFRVASAVSIPIQRRQFARPATRRPLPAISAARTGPHCDRCRAACKLLNLQTEFPCLTQKVRTLSASASAWVVASPLPPALPVTTEAALLLGDARLADVATRLRGGNSRVNGVVRGRRSTEMRGVSAITAAEFGIGRLMSA